MHTGPGPQTAQNEPSETTFGTFLRLVPKRLETSLLRPLLAHSWAWSQKGLKWAFWGCFWSIPVPGPQTAQNKPSETTFGRTNVKQDSEPPGAKNVSFDVFPWLLGSKPWVVVCTRDTPSCPRASKCWKIDIKRSFRGSRFEPLQYLRMFLRAFGSRSA